MWRKKGLLLKPDGADGAEGAGGGAEDQPTTSSMEDLGKITLGEDVIGGKYKTAADAVNAVSGLEKLLRDKGISDSVLALQRDQPDILTQLASGDMNISDLAADNTLSKIMELGQKGEEIPDDLMKKANKLGLTKTRIDRYAASEQHWIQEQEAAAQEIVEAPVKTLRAFAEKKYSPAEQDVFLSKIESGNLNVWRMIEQDWENAGSPDMGLGKEGGKEGEGAGGEKGEGGKGGGDSGGGGFESGDPTGSSSATGGKFELPMRITSEPQLEKLINDPRYQGNKEFREQVDRMGNRFLTQGG